MRIRKAMGQAGRRGLPAGIVETDETCTGGKPRNGAKADRPDSSHKRRRGADKAPVVGAVGRGSKAATGAARKERMNARRMRAIVRDRIDT